MPDGTAHSYRYEQLLALPQHELDATLCSAGVPGKAQIAHARWHGVLLSDLRENSAQDMFLRSANILSMDGKSTEISREQWQRALLAFTINGEPLPASLGYPARLIVPGSYDQHSPGWVTRIHFAHEQPTHASEDTPLLAAITSHHQNTRHSGVLHLSGVAYAGLADISQVEVSIDDADWMPIAFTRAAPGCWSTWSAEWQPALPGSVALTVRATDDAGRISLPHRIRIIIENI
jgi:DMSO/TMAO reductase YedYZ molybdopterin-dependent catalytic subunit